MLNFSVIKMSVFGAEWLCWNNHGSFASETDNGNSSTQSPATLNGQVAESWDGNLKPLVKISVCQVHRKLSFHYSSSKRSFQKWPSSERCTFQNLSKKDTLNWTYCSFQLTGRVMNMLQKNSQWKTKCYQREKRFCFPISSGLKS